MEDLWKKFKQETKEDLSKIKDFLNETSLKKESEQAVKRISRHLILDEETLLAIKNTNEKSLKSTNEKSQKVPRKNIYGKLKNIVKEIMEKENLSRAQAYRKAKERLLNI